jgi:tRNA(fMet)-specific endonuclease VapC
VTGYLLDTSTLVDLLRSKTALSSEPFIANQGRIFVSTVCAMELITGADRSSDPLGNRAQVEMLISLTQMRDYDLAAAEHTAHARAALFEAGTPIGPYDIQIAGHALSLGLTVVTSNVAEFSRVPGLKVENWRKAE